MALKAELIMREQIRYFISALHTEEYEAHWHMTAKPPKPEIPAITGRESPAATAFLHPVVTSPTDFIMQESEYGILRASQREARTQKVRTQPQIPNIPSLPFETDFTNMLFPPFEIWLSMGEFSPFER